MSEQKQQPDAAWQQKYRALVGTRFSHHGELFVCTSYDPLKGLWLESESDPSDRRCISERAVNRTFHEIVEDSCQVPNPK